MKAAFIVFAVPAALFGLIVGWIIGTQQASGRRAVAAAAAPAARRRRPRGRRAAGRQPVLDEAQATALRNIAETAIPKNVQSRVQLGNMYFDAERYQEAIHVVRGGAQAERRDVNVSTDLGVCYYYTDQPDSAIAQFEQSLGIDPKHTKTLLNMGIVKAFGKQDLAGAAAAWEQVIKLAPGSQEARPRSGRWTICRPPTRVARRAAAGNAGRPRDADAGGRRSSRDHAHADSCSGRCSASSSGGRSGGSSPASRRELAGAAARRPAPPRQPEKGEMMARDPVCGTFVVPSRACRRATSLARSISARTSAGQRRSPREAGSGGIGVEPWPGRPCSSHAGFRRPVSPASRPLRRRSLPRRERDAARRS